MLSLQEISHRVYIAENIYKFIQKNHKPFMVYDHPETIELVIKVLEGCSKISFVKLSDYHIFVIL